jgi:hypothetical protein
LVCIFLKKALIRFETTIPPKWLKFRTKIFKIFIRKRCNYRVYIVDKVSWCKLEVVSVNTTTDSLAKASIIFIDGIRFIHANQNHFFELFQIVANSETSSMEIVWVTFASDSIYFDWKFHFVQGSSKEHWYERDLLRNSRINRLVDFKSFSAETSSCKFALYKLWFSNTFSTDGLSVIISILLCGRSAEITIRNLTVKCFCKSRIIQ